ncbi:alpha/beta-hydrolase [Karstenula rhodostoma CBS 690.94]|uniref:Alpha/beta-hydrolase n=1 Tax=Karstenula rhodostoma CBS 690.94 TaxID=1392251 RepID=A0A9P4PTQ9_9PLEO|nr:alpha/beta-hydrolase [Karstenula rhodostoma CBS 690.94]
MDPSTKTPESDTAPDNPTSIAARGAEITGLDIFRRTTDATTPSRVADLMAQMHADVPAGGTDYSYGPSPTHILRYWAPSVPQAQKTKPPLIAFIHGGSWRVGTYLDSVGSRKVEWLVAKGYAFASINYTLVPSVTVAQQVGECAAAIAWLTRQASTLGFDAGAVVLMGHSSGAHVASLLGTDGTYLSNVGVDIGGIKGVVAIDGSNFNAAAEMLDSLGPVADNMFAALGKDIAHLRDMSPTYHARGPNARAFLLLQAQRHGDVRQAVEFEAALLAAGTAVEVRVFEGEFFEGHMAMLLRLGEGTYPATRVVEEWLAR